MSLTYPGNLTEGHIVTPHGVAVALERLDENPQHREALADAAYRNARPELDWVQSPPNGNVCLLSW